MVIVDVLFTGLPVLLEDELAKPSLVSPTVVTAHCLVAGALDMTVLGVVTVMTVLPVLTIVTVVTIILVVTVLFPPL